MWVCRQRWKRRSNWIRLTTRHFEIYTANGEKQGAAALNVFEQVRYFFMESSKLKAAPSAEQAYALFSTKAYCLVQLKPFLPTREMAEKAKQYAKTTEQQLQASAFLSHLDTVERQSSAPVPVADGLAATRPTPPEPAGDKPTILQRTGKHDLARDGRALVGQTICNTRRRW